MEQLLYDPRTKQQIKDSLYAYLYDPVQKRFKTRLDGLITRNTLLGGYRHKSFTYRGIDYSCDAIPIPRKRNQLLPQLQPEMDQYLKDVKEVSEKELPYVLGFINQVLNASNHFPDYLRLFPSSVHAPIEKMILSCSCSDKKLSEEKITEFLSKHAASAELMKQRQVINLIL